jgi:sterol desaturase/sphingolipid hydroxylase (fatty acid hydroxylase superfamily)
MRSTIHWRIREAILGTREWQDVLYFVFFVLSGVIFTVMELRRPARRFDWRAADVFATGVAIFWGLIFGLAFERFSSFLFNREVPFGSTWSWFGAGVFVFIGVDFVQYWIHRFLHTHWCWRIHRWHHSVDRLNWLTGYRASFFEVAISGVFPTAVALVWPEVGIFAAFYYVCSTAWMHTNIDIQSKFLLAWLVTPQSHRIHHSVIKEMNSSNFGNFWTIWDRIFGTWIAPNSLAVESREFELGTHDLKPIVRMAIGVN